MATNKHESHLPIWLTSLCWYSFSHIQICKQKFLAMYRSSQNLQQQIPSHKLSPPAPGKSRTNTGESGMASGREPECKSPRTSHPCTARLRGWHHLGQTVCFSCGPPGGSTYNSCPSYGIPEDYASLSGSFLRQDINQKRNSSKSAQCKAGENNNWSLLSSSLDFQVWMSLERV